MLRYELKKVFSKKINLFMLSVALLTAIAFSCFAVGSVRYTDKEGVLHTDFMASRSLIADKNRWRGELTAEKIAEIVKIDKELEQKYPEEMPDAEYGKTKQSYDDIIDFVINIVTPDSDYDVNAVYQLTDEQTKNLYTLYEGNMQEMIQQYGKTDKQKKFLKEQYKKIKMPLTYEPKEAWESMKLYGETYGIVLAVIIGFLVAGIFSEEFQRRADAVFFTSKYGRSKATKNKIVAGIFITTMVYWSGIGLLSLISFGIMGINGFQTLYQIDQPYSIYAITYGQYYLLILLCGYIACLLAASLTMLITAKMRTKSVAICIPFFMYCMMPFIGRLFSFTTLFHVLPNALVNIIQSAKTPLIFQVGTLVFRQIPFIMLLYTVISVVILPLVYRSYCRCGLGRV
jgi:hypothetical protein